MVADRAVGEGQSCYTVDAEFQYGKILEVCGTVYLKLAKKIHFIVFFFLINILIGIKKTGSPSSLTSH